MPPQERHRPCCFSTTAGPSGHRTSGRLTSGRSRVEVEEQCGQVPASAAAALSSKAARSSSSVGITARLNASAWSSQLPKVVPVSGLAGSAGMIRSNEQSFAGRLAGRAGGHLILPDQQRLAAAHLTLPMPPPKLSRTRPTVTAAVQLDLYHGSGYR